MTYFPALTRHEPAKRHEQTDEVVDLRGQVNNFADGLGGGLGNTSAGRREVTSSNTSDGLRPSLCKLRNAQGQLAGMAWSRSVRSFFF